MSRWGTQLVWGGYWDLNNNASAIFEFCIGDLLSILYRTQLLNFNGSWDDNLDKYRVPVFLKD